MNQPIIPIPRQGIFWGVQNLLLPEHEGDVYYLWNPSENMLVVSPDDWHELAIFDTEVQAMISIWLVGFSYQQMLVLWPECKNIQNIRNRIFPASEDKMRSIWIDEPRQLVDSEYLAIVRVVGKPNSKIGASVYKKYMEWQSAYTFNSMPFWLTTKMISNQKLDKFRERLGKKMSQINKLNNEINELNSVIAELEGT